MHGEENKINAKIPKGVCFTHVLTQILTKLGTFDDIGKLVDLAKFHVDQ
jgi:hypothetical protein